MTARLFLDGKITMSAKQFLDGRVVVYAGDCFDVLRKLPDCSIDSCCTDPPYALVSIAKRFGSDGSAPPKDYGGSGVYQRASSGFMGKSWDTGDCAFSVEFWREVFRVLKPGAHVLAFGGTRTVHRLACAIEDAGFEIRDQIYWHFGSGFPKSHDVSKAIDKAAGAKREVVGSKFGQPGYSLKANDTEAHSRGAYGKFTDAETECAVTAPATDDARQWQGWGTALKPATEPIVFARKPLSEGTVAANVLKHGTGAINIDGCRVATTENLNGGAYAETGSRRPMCGDEREGAALGMFQAGKTAGRDYAQPLGRWPANVVHDASDEVVAAFPETSSGTGAVKRASAAEHNGNAGAAYGAESRPAGTPMICHGDSGSAARFFYSAKADQDDRLGSRHPTVKPVDLMQWLVRLVTPRGGVVLDPFAGTGTTSEAAVREGCRAILIEREPEYLADIERRMELVLGGPDERRHATIKARGKTEAAGPLFEGLAL